jgi:hypothetical protein
LFGPELNGIFLLRIAILSMSIFALAQLVQRLDVAGSRPGSAGERQPGGWGRSRSRASSF